MSQVIGNDTSSVSWLIVSECAVSWPCMSPHCPCLSVSDRYFAFRPPLPPRPRSVSSPPPAPPHGWSPPLPPPSRHRGETRPDPSGADSWTALSSPLPCRSHPPRPPPRSSRPHHIAVRGTGAVFRLSPGPRSRCVITVVFLCRCCTSTCIQSSASWREPLKKTALTSTWLSDGNAMVQIDPSREPVGGVTGLLDPGYHAMIGGVTSWTFYPVWYIRYDIFYFVMRCTFAFASFTLTLTFVRSLSNDAFFIFTSLKNYLTPPTHKTSFLYCSQLLQQCNILSDSVQLVPSNQCASCKLQFITGHRLNTRFGALIWSSKD